MKSFFQISLLGLVIVMMAGVTPVSASQLAPATIRVGRTCSCADCTTVQTFSMETYVKRTLPAEWISGWHAESLKAGAVAIRTYGAYYVHNPRTSTYDICDTTCCQHMGDATYTSTDSATDATRGIYLLTTSNLIARCEYSAEANNSGCGDGKTNWCISDTLCAGQAQYGHGRGMCQWGSKRRADAGQSYATILDAYYKASQANYTRKELLTEIYDSGFTASTNWSTGTSAADKYGADYKYRSTIAASDSAVWTFNVGAKSGGSYDIYAWWPQGTNRSKTAPYVLPDNATVNVNQQANGGKWNLLGTKTLTSGSKTVKLSCWTTTGYIVVADAIKVFGPK